MRSPIAEAASLARAMREASSVGRSSTFLSMALAPFLNPLAEPGNANVIALAGT